MAAELTCIRSILELTAHDMNAVKGGNESLNETEQNLPLGGKDGVKVIVSPKLQYNLFKLPIMFPHNLFKLYNTVVGGACVRRQKHSLSLVQSTCCQR